MPKSRGFQARGMINPIMMARESRSHVPSGPSFRDKIEERQKSGFTFEDLKKIALKQQQGSGSEALERWENENYQESLVEFRQSKISEQEKEQLKSLRKEAKRHRKKRRRAEKEFMLDKFNSERGLSSDSSSDSDSKDKKHSKRKRANDLRKHPHRLSAFLNPKNHSSNNYMPTTYRTKQPEKSRVST
eukprot:Filipodium_phascolosomae@DN2950_c0_g1_i1.p1